MNIVFRNRIQLMAKDINTYVCFLLYEHDGIFELCAQERRICKGKFEWYGWKEATSMDLLCMKGMPPN